MKLDTELSVDDLKELVDRFKELYRDADRRGLPAGPAGAARAGDPRGVRLVDGRPRRRVPPHQPHPGRLGHGGERAADGVRQQGRQLVLGRRLLARRDHGRAGAVGRLPRERAGRGRRVGGTHASRRSTRWREVMPEAHAELMEILRTLEAHYRDMQDTEFTVEEGRLYMLQTRNAKRPAQAAVRFAVDAVEEGLLEREEALATIDAEHARRAAAPDLRPRRRLRRARARRERLARRREGRDRLHGRRGGRGRRGGPRRRARAPVHRGRRRGRLLRREGHPHERGRQGQPRRARRARHGPAVRVRRVRARDRPRRRARCASNGTVLQGGRPDRDRRHHRHRHDRRRAARRPRRSTSNFERVLEWADEVRQAGRARRTPTRRRTRARRASSAPRASASAAPSTCSWPRTASRRCAR